MPCRISFFFQFQGDRLAGWSENFWNSKDPGTDLNNSIEQLGVKLTQCKGNGVQWTRTRVSIPGAPRNGYTLLNVPIVQYALNTTDTGSNPDYQTTKWLLQLSHAPFPSTQPGQNSTRQWFGGVTDSSIQNAQYRANNSVSIIYSQLQGILQAPGNGWIMWQLNPAFAGNPIQSIDPATGIVTCANAISFGTAILVRVSRVRNLTYANGLWTWKPVTGSNTQVQLLNWSPQTNVMKTSPKATIRPQLYAPQTIISAVVTRSSNHRAGRPIGQFGGKKTKTGAAK